VHKFVWWLAAPFLFDLRPAALPPLPYMMQKTQPKEDPVGGQLARDANWVCAHVQAEKPHPDRPALSNITHNMPAAAGVGGEIEVVVERVWGGKIDPKFDCHYFDPTCAAGGSLPPRTSLTASQPTITYTVTAV